ncbi:MAG: hypothetical protein MJ252_06160 [archaeon]|nr:hypothetical protein [archaeon]
MSFSRFLFIIFCFFTYIQTEDSNKGSISNGKTNLNRVSHSDVAYLRKSGNSSFFQIWTFLVFYFLIMVFIVIGVLIFVLKKHIEENNRKENDSNYIYS